MSHFKMLFSGCAGGSIFCWDLDDGQLLRIIEQPDDGVDSADGLSVIPSVSAAALCPQAQELHCTSQLLVALRIGSCISMYNKDNGQLLARAALSNERIGEKDGHNKLVGYSQEFIKNSCAIRIRA